MNILISCPGRRVKTTEMLKDKFAQAGYGVIAAGNSPLIPALYAADQGHVVPSLTHPDYIPHLLELCRQEGVKGLFTMLDEDVLVLSEAREEFRRIGVTPLVVDPTCARLCDDKYETYRHLAARGFNCPLTFQARPDFLAAYGRGEIDFPVFVKPRVGTGSRGAQTVWTLEALERYWGTRNDILVQEYLDGTEYSLDTYIDTVSSQMVKVFCKEKLLALNGTFVQARSVVDPALFDLAEDLALAVGAIGALDIEVFKVRGEFYVCEINARMGGGYFTAQAAGVDFVPLMVNNIEGIANTPDIGGYEDGLLLLRYDRILSVTPERRLA